MTPCFKSWLKKKILGYRKSPASHKEKKNARLKPNLYVICYLRALGFLLEIRKERENGERCSHSRQVVKLWSQVCTSVRNTPKPK